MSGGDCSRSVGEDASTHTDCSEVLHRVYEYLDGEMTADEKHGLLPKGMGLSHRARAFVMLAKACLRP